MGLAGIIGRGQGVAVDGSESRYPDGDDEWSERSRMLYRPCRWGIEVIFMVGWSYGGFM